MVRVIQGFQVNTREAIDNRLVLSKEEMLNVNDNTMPDNYFAVCRDDGKLYIYDKYTDVISIETGKFSLYDTCNITSISINGVEVQIDHRNVDLPVAKNGEYGFMIAGKNITLDESGIISVDFNTIEDKSIPMSKVDFDDLIINGDIF